MILSVRRSQAGVGKGRPSDGLPDGRMRSAHGDGFYFVGWLDGRNGRFLHHSFEGKAAC